MVTESIEGTVDAQEWSETFQVWVYHVVAGTKTYWIYENDPTLKVARYGRLRGLAKAPIKLPDPIWVSE